MTFQFNPNQFVAAIQRVLKRYDSRSNAWIESAQSTDEDDNIFGILEANGFEDYRRNCLDDIAYVVFKVRGIEWSKTLKLHMKEAQLDRVASMLKEEK